MYGVIGSGHVRVEFQPRGVKLNFNLVEHNIPWSKCVLNSISKYNHFLFFMNMEFKTKSRLHLNWIVQKGYVSLKVFMYI